jgi:hypothetical protein
MVGDLTMLAVRNTCKVGTVARPPWNRRERAGDKEAIDGSRDFGS